MENFDAQFNYLSYVYYSIEKYVKPLCTESIFEEKARIIIFDIKVNRWSFFETPECNVCKRIFTQFEANKQILS